MRQMKQKYGHSPEIADFLEIPLFCQFFFFRETAREIYSFQILVENSLSQIEWDKRIPFDDLLENFCFLFSLKCSVANSFSECLKPF